MLKCLNVKLRVLLTDFIVAMVSCYFKRWLQLIGTSLDKEWRKEMETVVTHLKLISVFFNVIISLLFCLRKGSPSFDFN